MPEAADGTGDAPIALLYRFAAPPAVLKRRLALSRGRACCFFLNADSAVRRYEFL